METIRSWLEQMLGIGPDLQTKILATLLAVLAISILHQLALRGLIYRIRDLRIRYRWQKLAGYMAVLAGLLLIWPIWFQGQGWRSLATYLGLLSAGLAIALKDPITNLMGWAFILWRRVFEVGDRIEIAGHSGDVIDQRIFQFTLIEIGNWVDAEQSTGRILHVPNGMIFTEVLANYTKGSEFIWNEIPVLITFESNWEKAKAILTEIADRHTERFTQGAQESFEKAARQYMLNYGTLGSTVYTSVKDSGVLLTVRYLCRPRQRRNSAQTIWEEILHAFARDENIDFAYPTQRMYLHATEGKQAQNNHSQEKKEPF